MPLSTACWDTCCTKHLASELIGFPGVQVKLAYGSRPVLGPPVGRPCSKIIFRETYSAVTYNSQEGHFLGCVCSCLVPAARRLQLFPCPFREFILLFHMPSYGKGCCSSNKLGWDNHSFVANTSPDLKLCSETEESSLSFAVGWQQWVQVTQLCPSVALLKQVSMHM